MKKGPHGRAEKQTDPSIREKGDISMDESMYALLCDRLEGYREEMLEDLCGLLRIPSVSQPSADPGAPYGVPCRRVLDGMLSLARKAGLETENFENRIGMASLPGTDPGLKPIRVWNHLDVVPAGDEGAWHITSPFEPVRAGDYLIARGADDNTGPAVAVLYILRAFRDLGIRPRHTLCQCFGTDEERGMTDVLRWREAGYPSQMNIVADCGFPVCYAEKGMIGADLISAERMEDVLSFRGSEASNIIPDRARVVLKGRVSCPLGEAEVTEEEDRTVISSSGTAGHSAFPEGAKNALLPLCRAAADSSLEASERRIFDFYARVLSDVTGKVLGIDGEADGGPTTCVGTMADVRGGHTVLHLNIRYAVDADGRALTEALARACAENGCRLEAKVNEPNRFPPDRPVVRILTENYNRRTGSDSVPFAMAGGTYARKLPEAFAYGFGMPHTRDPILFPNGRGACHQPDEALYLPNLYRAMPIFAEGLLLADAIPD